MIDHKDFADDITLYALGELEAARSAEVRAHLATCAECQKELDELNAGLAGLALSTEGPAPHPRARQRLMDAISTTPISPRRLPVFRTRRPWWNFAPHFAAAILALFALMLWSENRGLRDRLQEADAGNAQSQADLQQARGLLSALVSADTVRVSLVSKDAKPQPQVRVMYMRSRGAVMIIAGDLAPTPEKKVYELWLLPKDGKAPVAFGTFAPDPRGAATTVVSSLPKDLEPKGFAITIENEGGSSAPTSPIIMQGS